MQKGDEGQTRDLLQPLALFENRSKSLKVAREKSNLLCVLIMGELMAGVNCDTQFCIAKAAITREG
jgi:hypothetical protein